MANFFVFLDGASAPLLHSWGLWGSAPRPVLDLVHPCVFLVKLSDGSSTCFPMFFAGGFSFVVFYSKVMFSLLFSAWGGLSVVCLLIV